MNARRGSALVEIVVAAGIISMVMIAVARSIRAAQRSAEVSSHHQLLEMRVERALDQLRRSLPFAGISTLRAVPAGGSTDAPMVDGVTYDNVAYGEVRDAGAGGPQYGPTLVVGLRPDPHDPPDLRDDDGDGAVDEQLLVASTPGTSRVLLTQVQAFAVVKIGAMVSVSVTAVDAADGAAIAKQAAFTTTLPND